MGSLVEVSTSYIKDDLPDIESLQGSTSSKNRAFWLDKGSNSSPMEAKVPLPPEPSFMELFANQIKISENQNEILQSCNNALVEQRALFPKIVDVLQQVSLTQEKILTSK